MHATSAASFHGLAAGFLRLAKLWKQCVEREVMEKPDKGEEHHFGSQPRPYPVRINGGFIADYESGGNQGASRRTQFRHSIPKTTCREIPRASQKALHEN